MREPSALFRSEWSAGPQQDARAPEDVFVAILDDIRKAIADAAYRISGHAADQMVTEDLDEIWVLKATISGELIDTFPSAYPHPSCLVRGDTPRGRQIHALWAYDPVSGYAALLTFFGPEQEPMSLPRALNDEAPGPSGPVGCVRCGAELDYSREIDRLVREGNDVGIVRVRADVCPLCGEVLLNPGMPGLLLDARDTLRQGRAGWATGCVYDLRRRGG